MKLSRERSVNAILQIAETTYISDAAWMSSADIELNDLMSQLIYRGNGSERMRMYFPALEFIKR